MYGYPIRNLKGKVTKIQSFRDEEAYHYEVELDVRTGDKQQNVHCYLGEETLRNAKRCTDNVNVLGEPKNNAAEALDVALPI